jgi:hypothetical protein
VRELQVEVEEEEVIMKLFGRWTLFYFWFLYLILCFYIAAQGIGTELWFLSVSLVGLCGFDTAIVAFMMTEEK